MTSQQAAGARLVVTSLKPLPDDLAGQAADLARQEKIELSAPSRLTGEAASFAVKDGSAAVLETLRRRFGERAWDVNRALERPVPRALLADMDSTVIPVECIDEVAEKAGAGEEVRAITESAMRGELPFAESLRRRLALCRGLPVAALEEIWQERITFNPGAERLVRTLDRLGTVTVLLSGGYRYFVERVAGRLGFSRWRCNDLEIEDGALTGRPVPPVLDRGDKAAYLQTLCGEIGCAPEEVAAVGDGANDLDMIREAGLGIAWRPKPLLREAADAVLDHSGLDAILHVLGVAESNFARIAGSDGTRLQASTVETGEKAR